MAIYGSVCLVGQDRERERERDADLCEGNTTHQFLEDHFVDGAPNCGGAGYQDRGEGGGNHSVHVGQEGNSWEEFVLIFYRVCCNV